MNDTQPAHMSRSTKSPRREDTQGTITVIAGCMFSGKTTALMRLLSQFNPGNVLAVKPEVDTRYSRTAIVSHGGLSIPARPIRSAAELIGLLERPTCIVAIDEAHFFDVGLSNVIDGLTQRGLDVAITTLDFDSWGRSFPLAAKLADRADRVFRPHTTCARCGQPAQRTQRLTPIVDGQLVGGSESYEPRCRVCWKAPPEPPPPLELNHPWSGSPDARSN